MMTRIEQVAEEMCNNYPVVNTENILKEVTEQKQKIVEETERKTMEKIEMMNKKIEGSKRTPCSPQNCGNLDRLRTFHVRYQ